MEDELKEIAKEIVRCDAVDKVMIGLDYFDASINRLSAWVTGQRAMQQALLCALLTPHEELKALQEAGNFTKLMVRQEQLKTLPWGIVWEEYLERQGLNVNYLETIHTYEENILKERA